MFGLYKRLQVIEHSNIANDPTVHIPLRSDIDAIAFSGQHLGRGFQILLKNLVKERVGDVLKIQVLPLQETFLVYRRMGRVIADRHSTVPLFASIFAN